MEQVWCWNRWRVDPNLLPAKENPFTVATPLSNISPFCSNRVMPSVLCTYIKVVCLSLVSDPYLSYQNYRNDAAIHIYMVLYKEERTSQRGESYENHRYA